MNKSKVVGSKILLKELLKEYRLEMLFISVFNLISTFGVLLIPYFLMKVSDAVSGNLNMNYINKLLLTLIGVFCVQAIINFITGYYTQKVGEQMANSLKTNLFRKIIHMPMNFYDSTSSGEISARLTNDVDSVKSIMVDYSLKLVKDSFIVMAIVILLLVTNPMLTFVIISAVLVIGIGSNVALNKIKSLSTEVQTKNAQITSFINESFVNVSIIKAFVREQYMVNKLSIKLNDFLTTVLNRNKIISLIRPMVNLVSYLLVIAVFWFALRQVINGQINTGDLLGYFGYTFILAASITTLTSNLSGLKKELGSIEEIGEIYTSVSEKYTNVDLKQITGDIDFKDLVFSYENEKTILNGINLNIRQGYTTAIVGPSGAGKSTIINLLLKNCSPTKGDLTIGHHYYSELSSQHLRNSIGVVLQNPYLFNMSIFENILFGRPDATREEVLEAAKLANVDEFVKKLPNGYNTIVGEMGNKVSRGQAQRIALARVILKNPQIIILDEATASLDNLNEAKILSMIKGTLKNKTIIIVTHRLNSITEADYIFYLNNGTIVESGTHEQLMLNKNAYYNMYQSNFSVIS